MAEEIKQEAQSCCCAGKNTAPAFLKMFLGLLFLGVGAWAVLAWFPSLKIVFQGCIGLLLILAGIVTLAIAKE